MKNKKFDLKIIIIIILIVVLATLIFLYINANNENELNLENETQFQKEQTSSNTSTVLVNTTGEIYSALTEQIELHATYYLEEVCIDENEYVEEDANLVKYENGEYMQAPYNCVISSVNVPNIGEQCTDKHYIEIESTNQLEMQVSIGESDINKVYIGQEATIKVSALDNKEYTGYVTNIANTATNGNFSVTVSFENDGEINIGMTGTCTIMV